MTQEKEIVCDCGHSIDSHSKIGAGCLSDADVTIPEFGTFVGFCGCSKSYEEIRYHAYQLENKKLRELSEFLFDQLWELVTDGDDPDFTKIKEMVTELNFDMTKWPFSEL